MSTVLTHAIIDSAINRLDEYVSSANTLQQELQDVITTLISSNFNGDASDGYNVFYTTKVLPALTENLTDPNTSLTAGIRGILEGAKNTMLDTVDPQMGENNKNAGSAQ